MSVQIVSKTVKKTVPDHCQYIYHKCKKRKYVISLCLFYALSTSRIGEKIFIVSVPQDLSKRHDWPVHVAKSIVRLANQLGGKLEKHLREFVESVGG